ncbi:MAG: NUDIX domain-containing protein [Candidatus Micrarchaeia archaeon]
MSEPVAVVDARGRPLGRATRRTAHAKGLLHRSVHVLLFDGRGRLFVQRRALSKELYPGKFAVSASGHVRFGENVRQAAARELAEELGVRGVKLVRIATILYSGPEENELCTYFKAVLPQGARLSPNRKELIPRDSRFLTWRQAAALGVRNIAPSLAMALSLHRKGRI